MKGKGISPLLATVLKPLFFVQKAKLSDNSRSLRLLRVRKEKSLGFKRKYYTKGISPLLATVLLIAITVATTTMLSGWVSSTTSATQNTIANKTTEGVSCAAAEIVIDDTYITAGTTTETASVILRNSGMTDDLTITSAQLYNKNGDNITATNMPISNFDRGTTSTLSFNFRPAGDSSKYGNNGSVNGHPNASSFGHTNAQLQVDAGRYGSGMYFRNGGHIFVPNCTVTDLLS